MQVPVFGFELECWASELHDREGSLRQPGRKLEAAGLAKEWGGGGCCLDPALIEPLVAGLASWQRCCSGVVEN